MVILFIMAMNVFPGEQNTVFKSTPFKYRQRPMAFFTHDEHNEKADIAECHVCHHLYRNGVKVEDESSEEMGCSDCHPVNKGGPTRPLMKAYHGLCKGCHRNQKVGPIMCGECHPPD